ncbi:DNA-processing protein DprA [Geomonas subterranea]|uniref:DNA-processing protein DprA n=1 Tax=Geomonas subterranea TaxID=2847989 RepID=A0ABX8LLY8_9BACT|nr:MULTISPECIES: DNA-processing protein DprA [Geomonas]QXE92494.1 DNA-processing protein DprA [Geomonas subterranea]QXM09407.1 DNA-processing protein DprA [Geomonas subterranea]
MDHYYWFALKSVPQVGNVTFLRLLSHFGSPEQVLKASVSELSSVKGVSAAAARSIAEHDFRAWAEAECERVHSSGVQVVDILSHRYPRLLMQIADPPPFFYLMGALEGSETAVAMVGSRHASQYGLCTATRLAKELAGQGVTVISGMARGIDTASHWGCLKAEGRSVAVLGCGVDVIYPPENDTLYRTLCEGGALISEFPMGTSPLPENFPRRNRIISALALGVVVVEAGEGSGSLITAQYALEQGREVFAVPGNVTTSGSRGVNGLIKQGAKLVERVEDILEELAIEPLATHPLEQPRSFPLTPQEAELYALLCQGVLQIDDIIVQSALTASEVSATLLRLEMKGIITQLPGKRFVVV